MYSSLLRTGFPDETLALFPPGETSGSSEQTRTTNLRQVLLSEVAGPSIKKRNNSFHDYIIK